MPLTPNATLHDVAAIVRKHGRSCTQPIPAERSTFNPHHAPLRTVSPTEHRQTNATTEKIDCPLCTKTFAGAVIVTSEPAIAKRSLNAVSHYVGRLVYRQFFCNHCDAIFCWYQESREDGSLGAELGRYRTIRDRPLIDKFLREHPEAKGVE